MRKVKIDKERFVKMWNDNVPYKRIAKELGISFYQVKAYANRHQEECPPRLKNGRIERKRFIAMWNWGVPEEEIAHYFRVQVATVKNFAFHNRAECPNRYEIIPLEEFVELWGKGILEDELAKHFHVCVGTVSMFARKHRDRCPKRKYGEKMKIDEEKFIKMWNEGVSGREIASYFDVAESTVSCFAKRRPDQCPPRLKKWQQIRGGRL